MKFAAQENLIPGNSFREKVENLSRFGYEGVELRGDKLPERIAEIKAGIAGTAISPTCVCGGFKFGLLSPNKEDRVQSCNEIKQLLAASAEVGAAGVIVVPIFGPAQLPDMTPWKTAVELEEELLVEQLYDLAAYAGEQGTQVILEPLNRYETHYIKRLEQAVHICERVESSNMTILADFFHMNIEEADIAKSIKEAAKWIGYVHLADSNRLLPGMGHTNFKDGFAALQEIGYKGWMSLECGVPGNAEETLSESLRFMKAQL